MTTKNSKYEFNVQKIEEVNVIKFVSLHHVMMGYFAAQQEVLVENLGLSLEAAKTAIYHKEINRKQKIKYPNVIFAQYPPPDKKMISSAMKSAERKMEKERQSLQKTFNDFISINNRMLDHMEGVMEQDKMDQVVETFYQFTDKTIIKYEQTSDSSSNADDS